jgi:hypothetical protein
MTDLVLENVEQLPDHGVHRFRDIVIFLFSAVDIDSGFGRQAYEAVSYTTEPDQLTNETFEGPCPRLRRQ